MWLIKLDINVSWRFKKGYQRKSGREPQLRIVAQEDPPLIDLLVRCLTGGKLSWVTGEEKQAAEFLRGLK